MSLATTLLTHTFDRTHSSSADEFFDWIKKNRNGFVINTYQETSQHYIKLHKARCGIVTSTKRNGRRGATQHKYKKICSRSLKALVEHFEGSAGIPFEERFLCRHCKPRELKPISPIDSRDEIILSTDEMLEEEGGKKLMNHFATERSRKNRRIVLQGHPQPYVCQACGLSLTIYGREYARLIHVHHTKPVGRRIKSPKKKHFLLLCPNCHAVAHWGRATDPLSLKALQSKAKKARAQLAILSRKA